MTFKNVMMVAFVWLTFGVVNANAATFKVIPYTTAEGKQATEIEMVGGTEEGDADRLMNALERTIMDINGVKTKTFNGWLKLEGPGGNMFAGIEVAEMVQKYGIRTYVGEDGVCASACGLIWTAGAKRDLIGNARVGYHAPYTPSVEHMAEMKEREGWLGVQNNISAITMYFIAHVMKYGVAKPDELLIGMSNSTYNRMFWITNDNLNVING